MKRRSIGMMILLIIVTLGIYGIYWSCSTQNRLKKETGLGFGGTGHFFMMLFTFGIYAIYWQYAAGKRIHKLGGEDLAVVYLVLSFFTAAFLNPFLMQHNINKNVLR